MIVFDASALLAFLQQEPESDAVEAELESGGACGSANWPEVADKVMGHGRSWDLARALLLSYDLEVHPLTMADAEWAARRWRGGGGLSLADGLCLALGHRLECAVLTADSSWPTTDQIRQIR